MPQVLYTAQPYPDNYTDPDLFLRELVTNARLQPKRYWQVCTHRPPRTPPHTYTHTSPRAAVTTRPRAAGSRPGTPLFTLP